MTIVTVKSAETAIGCAIKVHSTLGPGLFESVYKACLAHELRKAGLTFREEAKVPLNYDGVLIDCAFRADLIIEEELIVEIKSVDQVTPTHRKQLLTYLKLTGLKKGLVFNFNSPLLKDGIVSIVG